MGNISVKEFKDKMDTAMDDGRFVTESVPTMDDAVKECIAYALEKVKEYKLEMVMPSLELEFRPDGTIWMKGRQLPTIDNLIRHCGAEAVYDAMIMAMDATSETAKKYREILAHRPQGAPPVAARKLA